MPFVCQSKSFMGLGIPPQQPSVKGEFVNLLEPGSSPQLLSLVLEGGTETMAAQIPLFSPFLFEQAAIWVLQLKSGFSSVPSVGL